MFYLNFLIPGFILIIFLFAIQKSKEVYNNFLIGIKKGLNASLELFPYFLSMIFATTLLEYSCILDDFFSMFNLDFHELYIQSIFKPISGGASQALMLNIYDIYQIDSKESIISSILHSSSDTTLYVATIYTSICGLNKAKLSLFVGVFLNILSFIFCILMYKYFVLI